MATLDAAVAAPPPFSPPPPSPWHSPVPYLFGGLAAMLGLIAFALLVLACSYWKGSGERDLESGENDGGEGGDKAVPPPVMEEKFLVIMAGQEMPTYLATPMSSRTSSFCSNGTWKISTVSSEGSTLFEGDIEGKIIENDDHESAAV